MKRNNFIKLGIFLFAIPLFLSNCVTEQYEITEQSIETISVNEALSLFKTNGNTSNRSVKTPNYIPHLKEIVQEKMKNTDELLTVIPVTPTYGKHNSRILLLKINNKIESVIFNMLEKEGNSDIHFTGKIIITDLEGNFLNGYRTENGILISQYKIKEKLNKASFFSFISFFQNLNTNSEFCKQNPLSNSCIQSLDEVIVTAAKTKVHTGIPIINIYVDGSPNFSDEQETISWIANDGGGGAAFSSCDEGYVLDENNNCVEDDKIDSTQLTGKEKCLNDSLTKNGNTFVKDLLANFNGNSEFDINISSKDKVFRNKTTVEINGKTIYKPGTTLINIHISTNQMSNRNSLSCIRTLLHEYIHADMYRKLNTSKKPTGGDIDFKQTYNDFDNNNFKASPQHETMAKLYIGEMKNALKEAHNKLIPNEVKYYKENYPSNTLDNIYEALAWQGLKEHKVKAWLDKGNDTININKTINTKLSGLTKEFCK